MIPLRFRACEPIAAASNLGRSTATRATWVGGTMAMTIKRVWDGGIGMMSVGFINSRECMDSCKFFLQSIATLWITCCKHFPGWYGYSLWISACRRFWFLAPKQGLALFSKDTHVSFADSAPAAVFMQPPSPVFLQPEESLMWPAIADMPSMPIQWTAV